MLLRKLMLGAALGGLLFSTQAQPSLADLVSEAQAEWMFGSWEGTTSDGTALTHSFKWELDKKVVVMSGKAGEMSYLGIASMDQSTGEPKYVGFDNQGNQSTGTWADEGGDVALRLESTTPDGAKRKMAVVFGKASGGGLEMRLHQVDQWGYLDYPAGMTIKLKKKESK
jgi:hypothetical protein